MINRQSVFKIVEANPALSGFELWYKCYPRHEAKGDAFKAWGQTSKQRPAIEEMLVALEKQKSSDAWHLDSGHWIPLPGTYLRAWRWADE